MFAFKCTGIRYTGEDHPPGPPSGVKLQDSPSSFLLCGWNDPSTKPYNWGPTAMADTLRKECSPLSELMRYSFPKLSLHSHFQGKTTKCALHLAFGPLHPSQDS